MMPVMDWRDFMEYTEVFRLQLVTWQQPAHVLGDKMHPSSYIYSLQLSETTSARKNRRELNKRMNFFWVK